MKDKQDLFLELYEPQKERLWRFCLSISFNYEDAKELLAETIYQSYINFDKVRNETAFLSYMFTIASRINNKRTKKSRIEYWTFEDLDNLTGNSETPENLLEYKEMYLALKTLPNDQKEAIILSDLMGFSRKEISEIQNTNIENVKVRLYRGRKKLAKLLGLELSKDNLEVNEFISLPRSII